MTKKGLPAIHPGEYLSETLGEIENLSGRVCPRYRRFAHANFAYHQKNAPGNG